MPRTTIAISVGRTLNPNWGSMQDGDRHRDPDQRQRRDGAAEVRGVDRGPRAAPACARRTGRRAARSRDAIEQRGDAEREVLRHPDRDARRARPVGGIGEPGEDLADELHQAAAPPGSSSRGTASIDDIPSSIRACDHGVIRPWTPTSDRSTAIARIIAGMAPNRISVGKLRR